MTGQTAIILHRGRMKTSGGNEACRVFTSDENQFRPPSMFSPGVNIRAKRG